MADDRVYIHVVGLPTVYKLKISRSSPLRHLFAHVPAQSYAPPLSIGPPEYHWNDIKLDPAHSPAHYGMEPGEEHAHTVFIHFPLSSPRAQQSPSRPPLSPRSSFTVSSAMSGGALRGGAIAAASSPISDAARTEPAPTPTPAAPPPPPPRQPMPAGHGGMPDDTAATFGATLVSVPSSTSLLNGSQSMLLPSDAQPRGGSMEDMLGQYVRSSRTAPPAVSGNSPAADPRGDGAAETMVELRAQLADLAEAERKARRDAEVLASKLAEVRESGQRAVGDERAEKEAALERLAAVEAQCRDAEAALEQARCDVAGAMKSVEHDQSQRALAERLKAENEVLRTEVEEATRRSEDFREAAEAARQRTRELELRERDMALSASRAQDSRHSEELALLRKQLAAVDSRIAARDDEIEQFKQLVREKDHELQRLHVEVNDRDARLRAATRKAEEDAAAIDEYLVKLESTERAKDAARKELEELQEKCEQYLEEAKAASQNALRFEEALRQADNDAEALRGEVAALRADHKAVRRQLDDTRSENPVLQAELQSARRAQQAAEIEREGLQEKLARAQHAHTQAEQEAASLRAKLVRVSETSAAFEKDSDAALADLREQLATESAEVDALQAKLSAVRESAVRAAEAAEEQHKRELSEVQATGEQRLASARADVAGAQRLAEQRDATIAELENALVECNESMRRLRRENNELHSMLRTVPQYRTSSPPRGEESTLRHSQQQHQHPAHVRGDALKEYQQLVRSTDASTAASTATHADPHVGGSYTSSRRTSPLMNATDAPRSRSGSFATQSRQWSQQTAAPTATAEQSVSRSSSVSAGAAVRPVVVIRDARVSVAASTTQTSTPAATPVPFTRIGQGTDGGERIGVRSSRSVTPTAEAAQHTYPQVSTASPRVGRARVPRSTSQPETIEGA